MTDTTKKAGRALKAQKASDKATLKMHDDVTSSLEQLEHPGMKTSKVSSVHKPAGAKSAVPKTGTNKTGTKPKKK